MNTVNSSPEDVSEDSESWESYTIKTVISLSQAEGEKVKEILQELEEEHCETFSPITDESMITDALEGLLNNGRNELRVAAAVSYGYLASKPFLKYLSKKITTEKMSGNDVLSEYQAGVEYAVKSLERNYFGGFCSSVLPYSPETEEAIREEFQEMSQILEPIIAAYSPKPVASALREILEGIAPDETD